MRVTPLQTNREFLDHVASLNERLQRRNLEIASGKKVNNLQDAPAGSAELVKLRDDLAEIDQFRKNSDVATFFVAIADSTLNSVQNSVTAIFSRASQVVSNFHEQEVLDATAREIRTIRDQLLDFANTKVRDRYIFSGSQVTTASFTLAGDTVTYQGDGLVNQVQVSDGLTVRGNVIGSDVFTPIFDLIETLVTALDAGDRAGIGTALDQFSSVLAGVGQTRAQVGIDLSTLQNLDAEYDARELGIRGRMSGIADADLPKSISQLRALSAAVDAAYGSHSFVGQRSLFDFLG